MEVTITTNNSKTDPIKNHFLEESPPINVYIYILLLLSVRAVGFGFHMQVFNLHPKVIIVFHNDSSFSYFGSQIPIRSSIILIRFASGCCWKFQDYFSFPLILFLFYFGLKSIIRQVKIYLQIFQSSILIL